MTKAARQRREAHRTRLALPRALHQARMAAPSFQRVMNRRNGAPHISISKHLRKHRDLLLSTLWPA